MKTTKEIIFESVTKFESFKDNIKNENWYSEEEYKKAQTQGIKDLRDIIQIDLIRLQNKYTKDFDNIINRLIHKCPKCNSINVDFVDLSNLSDISLENYGYSYFYCYNCGNKTYF